MAKERSHRSVFLPILGIILLIPPILLTVRWITIFNKVTTNQADRVAEFLAIFPVVLQDARLLTWIEVIFCVGAILAGFVGILRLRGGLRFVSVMVLVVGGLMTLWLLFTLM